MVGLWVLRQLFSMDSQRVVRFKKFPWIEA